MNRNTLPDLRLQTVTGKTKLREFISWKAHKVVGILSFICSKSSFGLAFDTYKLGVHYESVISMYN